MQSAQARKQWTLTYPRGRVALGSRLVWGPPFGFVAVVAEDLERTAAGATFGRGGT